MSRKLLFYTFSLLVLLQSCKIINKTSERETYSSFEIQIFNLVNQHRKKIGKEKLVLNKDVWKQATLHTQYQIKRGKISHDGFSKRMSELQKSIEGYSAGAENVAFGYGTAETVVKGWLESPGHKKNIEGNYNLTGISAIKNSKGIYFYTQIFCKN